MGRKPCENHEGRTDISERKKLQNKCGRPIRGSVWGTTNTAFQGKILIPSEGQRQVERDTKSQVIEAKGGNLSIREEDVPSSVQILMYICIFK